MGFVEHYTKWLNNHLRRRKGERKDRLRRGHNHAEQLFLKYIWWPLYGSFQGLHPEYEVMDWRGMRFFVDFMFCIGNVRIAFEIKGYGPHVEQTDRTKYRRELNRELFLQGIGIQVVSIPYDELEQNPELIRTLVRMILTPYLSREETGLPRMERALINLAIRLNRVIRPIDATHDFGISTPTAVKYLKQLCEKGLFQPAYKGKALRINKYEYIGPMLDVGARIPD